ncbi:MAG: domain S-box protein [Patescibacteria group bacterium]|nr:domain S-box protein [Patescibacteria group bacterium]
MKPNTNKTSNLRRRIIQLAQQQAENEALFDSIGQGALATDQDGKISRINQVALEILGLKRSQAIGKWFPEVIIAEDENGQEIELLDRPITTAFLTGEPVTTSMYYRHKKGSVVPVSVTVSPILMNGHPIGAVEVFRDTSHEQEIDRMKSEFIYLASHQLRTPLTAIKTYTHILQNGYSGQLTADQTGFMDNIIESVDRMNEIINTLLNISRIESGKLVLDSKPLLLANIIDRCLLELKPQIKAKNLQIRTNIQHQNTVNTDPNFVHEVCANLLSNAVKYTPDGGKVSVSIRRSGNEQIIRIQDTGYGIPISSKNHIFNKFYRSPNVKQIVSEGTGLGLYLSSGIVKALGGQLWFDSEEGKGSTFYFALPSPTQAKS